MNPIFNAERKYEEGAGSLFLQDTPGLLDTINRPHPQINDLYKRLKSQDWDENERDLSNCLVEFQTCSKTDYEIMIKTLAWQWETDSVAAHHLIPVVAPFVSSSDLWSLYVEIGKNEIVHGRTYSEIIKNSFVDPREVMKSVLAEKKALDRLEAVSNVFYYTRSIGLKLQTGEMKRYDPAARDAIMLFVASLLAMERVQFMPSFGITFGYADSGRFMDIGALVQKICNDEYNVHVQAGKLILANELTTKEGRESFERITPMISGVVNEIVQSELTWNEYIFSGNKQLVGCNKSLMDEFVLFAATDVYQSLGIKNPNREIFENPIGYMNDWVDMNNIQASAQEEDPMNYLLGGFTSTAGDKLYSTDDL